MSTMTNLAVTREWIKFAEDTDATVKVGNTFKSCRLEYGVTETDTPPTVYGLTLEPGEIFYREFIGAGFLWVRIPERIVDKTAMVTVIK